MIETPRAALVAGELAASARISSPSAASDLTQMTFGLSRDDAAPILARYAAEGIFAHDPFQTIDKEGVGRLVRMCATSAREASEKLDIGVCGEHGGDARSVEFFRRVRVGLRVVLAVPGFSGEARRRTGGDQEEGALVQDVRGEGRMGSDAVKDPSRGIRIEERPRANPAERA